jgi:truncated hemoglobin YjbI
MAKPPFEQIGGEESLRAIIDDFVDRVTGDMMIGFFFRAVDKDRLKLLERSFAEVHLGGRRVYEGRPLSVAHGPHRIMGGQFNRRLKILEETLRDHGVDEDIIKLWLNHNEQLRSHITRDAPNECIGSAGETTE